MINVVRARPVAHELHDRFFEHGVQHSRVRSRNATGPGDVGAVTTRACLGKCTRNLRIKAGTVKIAQPSQKSPASRVERRGLFPHLLR